MAGSIESVGIIGKLNDPVVTEAMRGIAAHLVERGVRVLLEDGADGCGVVDGAPCLPAAELASAVDLVIAVGGDGTMLHAALLAAEADRPVLGVNLGRLGFLADVSPDQAAMRLDQVLAGECRAEERRLLAAEVSRDGEVIARARALNDMVIQRAETGRMIEFQTWVDGSFVSRHRADGLIIATPTGSTAYALSGGGPIVHPQVDALVLVPICPHTLSDRPLVISASSALEVEIVAHHRSTGRVAADAHIVCELLPGDRVSVRAADHCARFLHPSDHDYFDILRSKLHWARGTGEDVGR